MTKKEVELVKGYLAGFKDCRYELPKTHNGSPAYKQGWANGRDDRNKQPRDWAKNIRARTELILNN